MARRTNAAFSLAPDAERAISLLGERVRTARRRRALPMEEMAERMGVTRKTLARLEKGDPGVSMSVFVSALWVLGLDKSLLDVAIPENDLIGVDLERRRLPKRARPRRVDDAPDF